MFGSADIGLKEGFYQLHWHVALWTSNRTHLSQRLKEIFPSTDAYDRPVRPGATYDLNFLPYKNKGIELPELLRHDRKHLADMMLLLDRTDPLALMALSRLRLGTQDRQKKSDP